LLADLGPNSDKRLQLYSELFKEIKNNINFISSNISSSGPEVDQSKSSSKINEKSYNWNKTGMKDIDEENEGEVENELESNNKIGINSYKNKKNSITKLKIQNNKTKINLEAEIDCNIEEESPYNISFPHKEYQSNNILNIDYFSNIKSCNKENK